MTEATLHALILQHEEPTPPGHVTEWLGAHGAEVEVVRIDVDDREFDPTSYDLIVSLGSEFAAFDDHKPFVPREARLMEKAVHDDVPVPASLREGITVEGVSFRYPGTERLVLEDVNLTLPAGSVVGAGGGIPPRGSRRSRRGADRGWGRRPPRFPAPGSSPERRCSWAGSRRRTRWPARKSRPQARRHTTTPWCATRRGRP